MALGRPRRGERSQETCLLLIRRTGFRRKDPVGVLFGYFTILNVMATVRTHRVAWVLCASLCLTTIRMACAQSDSLLLGVVTVQGTRPDAFMAGLRIQRLDSTALQPFGYMALHELLAFHSPLAFRGYGNGQLTTVAFRGTSSQHTALLWNGININSPGLGITDFSTVLVNGFDQLAIQYGSSASVIGSDAVGGSILLESTPTTREGLHLSLGRQQASFGNHQTQLSAKYASKGTGPWRWSGKTRGYLGKLLNRTPYTTRRGYFVEPSETAQQGLIQDVFLQNTQTGTQLSAHVWLTDNELVLAPQQEFSRELTLSKSKRALLSYQMGHWHFRAGWTRDQFDYGRGDFSQLDRATTDRLLARAEYDRSFRFSDSDWRLSLRTGAELSHYLNRVDNYAEALLREQRADLYALLRWEWRSRWVVSTNLRQALATGFEAPITPSLGAEYLLSQTRHSATKLRASVGRSYRVPTFNERFWRDLGNPNLRPEHGWNAELGGEYRRQTQKGIAIQGELTAYQNRIDDWVYWNPATNYRVENLQLVWARGMEASFKIDYPLGRWRLMGTVQYGLTRSSQERVYDPTALSIIGKQLIYVPLHNGGFVGQAIYKNTRLSWQAQAGSRRYYTFDNTKFLPGHMLHNLVVERSALLGKSRWSGQFQVNNVFDALLLNVKRNAMPGRSWQLTLTAEI